MKLINEYHVPALLNEAVDLLEVKPGEKYIDATLGGGGHSAEILKRGGELLAIDCDPDAVGNAQKRFELACPPAIYLKKGGKALPPKVVQSNFINLDEVAKDFGFEKVTGIIFDLGVSSHQLETPSRGFSFNMEGPLDMRMDPNLKVTAADLINGLSEFELYELFSKLGEEKFARGIARAICRTRRIKKIETCDELAETILRSVPSRGKFDRTPALPAGRHPATRVFQALRIAVNDELNNLRQVLPKTLPLLKQKGRLVILSFHSLEDGIVKRFFQEEEKKNELKIITKKPLTPTKEEVKINPRARSAKLRAAEKI